MHRKNRDGFRVCSCCKTEKTLNTENFCSDKNRLQGFSYRCRSCDSSKKDHRRERYKKLSEEEKTKHKAKNRAYTSQGLGRATALICCYRKIDRKKSLICDLDREFLVKHIFTKPCIYCGQLESIGCDRVDNKIGHLKTNVVPCCAVCNITRMDNFTHEEMLIIGESIKLIKDKRIFSDMHYQIKEFP